MIQPIDFAYVIGALGLKGAESHRSYERMVETWLDPNEPIPTLEQCETKWAELVASGMFEPPYWAKRKQAYDAAGITLDKVNELVAEYNLALLAGSEDVARYGQQLTELQQQRAAIKAQYPKG